MSKSTKGLTLTAAPGVRKFWQDNASLAAKVAEAAGVTTASVLGDNIRGRVNPAFYAEGTEGGDVLAKNGIRYAEIPKGGQSSARTVTIERVSPKTGRPVKPTVLSLSEARVLAGQSTDTKGVMSRSARALVASALDAAGR
jgi:hypothetical protein